MLNFYLSYQVLNNNWNFGGVKQSQAKALTSILECLQFPISIDDPVLLFWSYIDIETIV